MTTIDTHQKALQINLDATKYGTFAEIGAGQEAARWFFRVGGAAGTVAKTMSAYDMSFSDAIYGPSKQYVSRARLQAMLDHEYQLLLERLDKKRGAETTFFVYANTVAARSHTRREEGHGWLGIRFQTEPRGEPSQIIIHVRMFDTENVYEQEALGIIGVNLIYGAFFRREKPEALITSLLDELTPERIEVDVIKFSGPCFASVDNRLMSLQLVQQEFTDAAMFTADGETVQPSEVLYKKPILVERGSFRPITKLTLDMLERSQEQFLAEPDVKGEEPVVFMEMTLRNLSATGTISHSDFLARVDILAALGKNVLISNFARYFRLSDYLSHYTQKMIGIALGIPSMVDILNENFYTDLPGGVLEGMGRLCKKTVKLYVYPWKNPKTGEVVTVENLKVDPSLRHLYAQLVENQRIETIRNYNADHLPLTSREALAKLRSGDATWELMVPPEVARITKERRLFLDGDASKGGS